MQDIDAAYMLGSSADLDAGLSALLEVPDFDSHSSPSDHDLFSGGMMGMPAAGVHICLAPTYPHAASPWTVARSAQGSGSMSEYFLRCMARCAASSRCSMLQARCSSPWQAGISTRMCLETA